MKSQSSLIKEDCGGAWLVMPDKLRANNLLWRVGMLVVLLDPQYSELSDKPNRARMHCSQNLFWNMTGGGEGGRRLKYVGR